MQNLAIEVEYNSLDGSWKRKVLTSNSSNDTISHFIRQVRNAFKVTDSVEVLFKVKLILENEKQGNFINQYCHSIYLCFIHYTIYLAAPPYAI